MKKESILFSLDENITQVQIKKLKKIEFDKEKVEKLIKYCKEKNIKDLVWKKIFLKKTKNPPHILYYIWNIDLIKSKKIIWIVGPREITPFIKNYLDLFFEKIKDFENIAIVSGLADGTDSYAHNLSIKHNIPTISVLGFGLAKGLNGTTRHLIKKIVENNGLVLSEFKLKQSWTNWTFPQRNRVIAWLSDILFVPQAHLNSGTLITVNDAIDINTNVYSCFSIVDDEFGKWTNKLITEGKIKWIYDFEIFINQLKKELKISEKTNKKVNNINDLTNAEKEIIENIQKWNDTLEKIQANCNLKTSDILNLISMLELKGILKEVGGELEIN